jgi:hypothetical protein
LGLLGTQSREKHTAKPVHFGTPMATFESFDQCLGLAYRFNSF